MPVTQVALFAAAIYQQGLPQQDPVADRAVLELLAHAGTGTGVRLETTPGSLIIDGEPLPLDAPGASLVRQSLGEHHTARLQLPSGLAPDQWRCVVEVYSSAPGCYQSADDVRDALRIAIPEAIVSSSGADATEADLRDALFELPGLKATSAATDPARLIDAKTSELAAFEAALDALLAKATDAAGRRSYEDLAQAIVSMIELGEERGDEEYVAIVARERRRVVSSEMLDELARSVARPETPLVVARALHALGRDGAAALITVLTGARGFERRAYIEALVGCRDADPLLIEALSSARRELACDAAQILGRRRAERAVTHLGKMLKQPQTEVRTAAWHALELIGTREAMKLLQS